jgi:hypothetical protein
MFAARKALRVLHRVEFLLFEINQAQILHNTFDS